MTTEKKLQNKKIELSEIGDNSDLLEIVIENQFWFKYEDVKEAILEFEKYLYDDRTLKETCERRFKQIFGDFEK